MLNTATTLFGEGVKAKVKQLLLRECNLHTIIRLPKGVFAPYTSIKTNLLFFTKGKPTGTIWFYEHHYPKGQKSYSKTRPLRIEELQPIADWWGKERGGFRARVETEQAWKIDFAKLKADALEKAQPHWAKAESLGNEVSDLNDQLKDQRAAVKAEKKTAQRKKLEKQLAEQEAKLEALQQQAKDEQAAGDRHYWPIYNLDIKNPNSPEAEVHDPDKLLAKYKKLMSEIALTENKLRDELAAALSHQFEDGATE